MTSIAPPTTEGGRLSFIQLLLVPRDKQRAYVGPARILLISLEAAYFGLMVPVRKWALALLLLAVQHVLPHTLPAKLHHIHRLKSRYDPTNAKNESAHLYSAFALVAAIDIGTPRKASTKMNWTKNFTGRSFNMWFSLVDPFTWVFASDANVKPTVLGYKRHLYEPR